MLKARPEEGLIHCAADDTAMRALHGHPSEMAAATSARRGEFNTEVRDLRVRSKSMPGKPYNVLFLCTGNSARSILAEALINDRQLTGGRFRGYSAGSQPKGAPHPLALELLQRVGLPSGDARSKSWDEFAQPGAPILDFIFTVCDQAASEPCPYWPGQPMTAHWGMPDPAAITGSIEQQREAFSETLRILRRRIERFANLPIATLDRMSLQQRLHGIASA